MTSVVMGMLVVVAVIVALALIVALFVHALRADPSPTQHGWLVVVPLLIIAAWVIAQLIMG